MPSGSDSWIPADVMLLAEWMKAGNITMDDFEKEFGKIGKELPPLPDIFQSSNPNFQGFQEKNFFSSSKDCI